MERLFREMIAYYAGDPHQIQHLTKVHGFARMIGLAERIADDVQHVLEIAAIVHDIGIKPALEKHGSANGNFQEQEGPPVAEAMLRGLGYPEGVIARVCYLVGHHHTYTDVVGDDYQILIEADFLVNIFEGKMQPAAIRSTLDTIFRTETGKAYCRVMFQVD